MPLECAKNCQSFRWLLLLQRFWFQFPLSIFATFLLKNGSGSIGEGSCVDARTISSVIIIMSNNKYILFIFGTIWNFWVKILNKQSFIFVITMLDFKEENRGNRVLDAYINQNVTSESQSSTIHSAILKGRLSFGTSHHWPESKSKVIRIRQNSKQELPVLGQKCSKQQPTRRMYESLILNRDDNREPQIKRVKLSELTNTFTQSQAGQIKKRTQTNSSNKKILVIQAESKGISRKKKKAGYEGQKLRIQQAQNQINKFFSNYERFQTNSKLKDVMNQLKEEVLKTHSKNFLLLHKDK